MDLGREALAAVVVTVAVVITALAVWTAIAALGADLEPVTANAGRGVT